MADREERLMSLLDYSDVLSKRGFSGPILNAFCDEIEKEGDVNATEGRFNFPALSEFTQLKLSETTPLVLGVLSPIEVLIVASNLEDGYFREVRVDIPQRYSYGPIGDVRSVVKRQVTLGSSLFIDEIDFRMEPGYIGGEKFCGLYPGGPPVKLRYAPFKLQCDDVEFGDNGEPALLNCTAIFEVATETASVDGADAAATGDIGGLRAEISAEEEFAGIHWVPAEGEFFEARVYNLRRRPPTIPTNTSGVGDGPKKLLNMSPALSLSKAVAQDEEIEGKRRVSDTLYTPCGTAAELSTLHSWSRALSEKNETVINTGFVETGFGGVWDYKKGGYVLIDGIGIFYREPAEERGESSTEDNGDGDGDGDGDKVLFHTVDYLDSVVYRMHLIKMGQHPLYCSKSAQGAARTPILEDNEQKRCAVSENDDPVAAGLNLSSDMNEEHEEASVTVAVGETDDGAVEISSADKSKSAERASDDNQQPQFQGEEAPQQKQQEEEEDKSPGQSENSATDDEQANNQSTAHNCANNNMSTKEEDEKASGDAEANIDADADVHPNTDVGANEITNTNADNANIGANIADNASSYAHTGSNVVVVGESLSPPQTLFVTSDSDGTSIPMGGGGGGGGGELAPTAEATQATTSRSRTRTRSDSAGSSSKAIIVSIGAAAGDGKLTHLQRLELARKQEEEEKQAKLEELKQAQKASFFATPANVAAAPAAVVDPNSTTKSIISVGDEHGEDGSEKQMFLHIVGADDNNCNNFAGDLAAASLAEGGGLNGTPGGNAAAGGASGTTPGSTGAHNKKGSVAERFAAAKEAQRLAEEERLQKIKNDPSRLPRKVTEGAIRNVYTGHNATSTDEYDSGATGAATDVIDVLSKEESFRRSSKGSVKNMWEGVVKESTADQQNRTESFKTSKASGKASRGSLKNIWAEALNESKQNEEERFQQTKMKTQNTFLAKDEDAEEDAAATGARRRGGSFLYDDTTVSSSAERVEQEKRERFLNNKSSGSRASVRDMWAGALEDSRANEENRFLQTKSATLNSFTAGGSEKQSGFVKKQVGSIEEVIVQQVATAEEMDDAFNAAMSAKRHGKSKTGEELRLEQVKFAASCNEAEEFTIGTTHIYNVAYISDKIHSMLKKMVDGAKTKHFPLSCGVYGDSMKRPPIDAFAAAIKVPEGGYENLYISLTIKLAAGVNAEDNAVYGKKKVAIFFKDMNNMLMERLVLVLPVLGWESWVADGKYNSKVRPSPDSQPVGTGKKWRRAGKEGGDEEDEEGGGVYSDDDDDSDLEPDEEGDGNRKKKGSADEDDEDLGGDPGVIRHMASTDLDTLVGINISSEHVINTAAPLAAVDEEDEEEHPTSQTTVPVASLPHSHSLEEVEAMFRKEAEEEAAAAAAAAAASVVASPESPVASGKKAPMTPFTPAANEGNDTWRAVDTPHHTNVHSDILQEAGDDDDDDDADDGDKLSPLPPASAAASAAAAAASAAAREEAARYGVQEEDDGLDIDESIGDTEEVAAPYNFGRTLSVAKVGAVRTFLPVSATDCLVDGSQANGAIRKSMWGLDDEVASGLQTAQQTTIMADLSNVSACYCVNNCFVLETLGSITGNGTGDAGNTIVFTGNLKHASTTSKYVVDGNCIFEWIRGAAASGWLLKWPMRSQSAGRRTMRFFVLRNNLLSYHKTKPLNEDEVLSNYQRNSIHIDEASNIEVSRHRLQRCMTLRTSVDQLWFKSKYQADINEQLWMAQINKAIEQSKKKKMFLSKARVESIWYHESKFFNIVSVDGLSRNERYIKAALFCLDNHAAAESIGGAAVPNGQAGTSTAAKVAAGAAVAAAAVTAGPVIAAGVAAVAVAASASSANNKTATRRSSWLWGRSGASVAGEEEVAAAAEPSVVSEPARIPCSYSMDISTSETPRFQLELMLPNGNPDIGSTLSALKIHGEMTLLGGTNGFIGVAVVGRTKVVVAQPSSDIAVSGDFGGDQNPPLGGQDTSRSIERVPSVTEGPTSAAGTNKSPSKKPKKRKSVTEGGKYKRVMFCVPCCDIPALQQENSGSAESTGSTPPRGSEQQQRPSAVGWQEMRFSNASLMGGGADSSSPREGGYDGDDQDNNIGNNKNRGNPESSVNEALRNNNSPHAKNSTVVCFTSSHVGGKVAAARDDIEDGNTVGTALVKGIRDFFVAADNQGVLSFWHLDRRNYICNHTQNDLSEYTYDEDGAGVMNCLNIQPVYLSHFSLASTDPTGIYRGEVVNRLQLTPSDQYLVVSTSHRMIMLRLSTSADDSGFTVSSALGDIAHSPDNSANGNEDEAAMTAIGSNLAPTTPAGAMAAFTSPATSAAQDAFTATTERLPANISTSQSPTTAQKQMALDAATRSATAPLRVHAWVEIDRVLPGCLGVFALHINEEHGDLPSRVSDASPLGIDRIRAVQWRVVETEPEEEAEELKAASTSSSSTKVLHCGLPLRKERGKRECTVYRFEWNDEVYDSVVKNMKYL